MKAKTEMQSRQNLFLAVAVVAALLAAPHEVSARPQEAQKSIAGQVVVAPVSEKWYFGANNLMVTLTNSAHKPTVTTKTAMDGVFLFPSVLPGDYTLEAGAKGLKKIRVPLRVRKGNAPVALGVMVYLRPETDTAKSFAASIPDMPLRAELLKRVVRDQAIRNEMIQSGMDKPNTEIKARMVKIDADNTARVDALLKRSGWPGPERVGLDGSEAAFILVQHAVPDFQRKVQPIIDKAFKAHKISPSNYALFTDVVLVGAGKPQRYGTRATKVEEWKDHEPAFYPIEDEANLDKRREELGLMPYAEYRAFLKRMYFPNDAPKP